MNEVDFFIGGRLALALLAFLVLLRFSFYAQRVIGRLMRREEPTVTTMLGSGIFLGAVAVGISNTASAYNLFGRDSSTVDPLLFGFYMAAVFIQILSYIFHLYAYRIRDAADDPVLRRKAFCTMWHTAMAMVALLITGTALNYYWRMQ